eukprot:CAMPEP_0177617222 /NCGR_PEP_ID=MMETSP0419_2-20121207/24730_1 /TAXON_ID=582737 /ORGANISM="Tetraselmis sp., Strain GSL018" /LENGTH=94 /DNA_ID=CAMNT_0019115645 /DNA_START=504 /DNA_END=784 /DNA_ORIENTATION=+
MRFPLGETVERLRRNDPTLTQLEFTSYNGIGDEGAKVLAEALNNGALTELSLRGNGIGDEGAKALAAALWQNPALTELRLWGNIIGDEGAKALA